MQASNALSSSKGKEWASSDLGDNATQMSLEEERVNVLWIHKMIPDAAKWENIIQDICHTTAKP
ncbi:hypothetical protein RSAG8_12532, partial [Rhizoctonia solani AG-8 WAC10335]